jgi:signal transduction histidine kinase
LRDAAEGLLQIINDILDFSRLEAGGVIFEEINFDVRQLVDGVVSIMGVKAREGGFASLQASMSRCRTTWSAIPDGCDKFCST